jgi:hypothetical protein
LDDLDASVGFAEAYGPRKLLFVAADARVRQMIEM